MVLLLQYAINRYLLTRCRTCIVNGELRNYMHTNSTLQNYAQPHQLLPPQHCGIFPLLTVKILTIRLQNTNYRTNYYFRLCLTSPLFRRLLQVRPGPTKVLLQVRRRIFISPIAKKNNYNTNIMCKHRGGFPEGQSPIVLDTLSNAEYNIKY